MPQLSNKLELVGGRTRQAENIIIKFRKTRSAQISLFYEGVKMYNAVPAGIKQCDRLIIFKRRLKEFILTSLLSV